MLSKILFSFLLIVFVIDNFLCIEELNKYSYMLKRNYIKYVDDNKHNPCHFDRFKRKEIYNKVFKEHLVKLYFQLLKYDDIKQGNKYFYYPVEGNIDTIQKTSKLYKMLRNLPKGGNLHLHEFQELDRSKLIHLLRQSIDYEYLYICDQVEDQNCKNMKYFMNYFKNVKNVPNGWTRLNETKLTTQDIVEKTTLIGLLKGLKITLHPTDSELRWNLTQNSGLFLVYQSVSEYNTTRFRYMKAVLDSAIDENIQLLEFRRFNFGTVWYYSENGSREYIPAATEIGELEKLKKEFLEKHPNFIDFSFIIIGRRSLPNSEIDTQLNTAIDYNKMYPHLIRGFDLVEEEDRGHTLLYHSDNLIKARNYGKKESNDTFKLYLHNSETSWAEDQPLLEGKDDVSTIENIYDALVLETHRIGYGLGYIKHPQLYKILIEKDIAIELCLTSNHVLSYVPDLRNHPGINYYRSGVPVVLAGGDPGSFGYNELTIEFYLAILAWDFTLYDLKQLAYNSIKYSSLSRKEKPDAYAKWNTEWNKFIDKTFDYLCNIKFNTTIDVSDILPSYSYLSTTTNITIYGNGFENLFCKNIICMFGDFETHGHIIHLNEIVCESPIANKTFTNLPFKILAKSNDSESVNELITEFKFTLLSNPKLFSRKNVQISLEGFITLKFYFLIFAFDLFYLL